MAATITAEMGSPISFSLIAVNVDTLYREFRGDDAPADAMRLFGVMAELSDAWRRESGAAVSPAKAAGGNKETLR